MIIEESEYKGKPLIVLKNDENDRFPFQFGVSKARKVLEAHDAIAAFVKKHSRDNAQS